MRLKALFISLFFYSYLVYCQNEDIQVFQATETNGFLINPWSGMVNYGIEVSYGEREIDHYIHPESIVYLRVAWSDLEPEEGVFNFERFERIRDLHLKKGAKQWAFRIVTVQGIGSKGKEAAPGWIKSIAKGTTLRSRYWEPQYGDSVYVKKLEILVNTISERYDGDPTLAFVDISGLGLYSEWGDPESQQEGWEDVKKRENDTRKLIDIYLKAFKKTPLAISTHIIGPNMENRYSVMYAIERGAWIRRDGIGSPFFHSGHKSLVEKYWKERPVISEMYAIYSNYNDTVTGKNVNWSGWSFRDVVDQVLDQHSMCAEMSRDLDVTDAFLRNPQFQRLANETGYRLVLSKVEFNKSLKQGNLLIIKQWWKNQGVSKLYVKFPLRVFLMDKNNNVVWSAIDHSIDPSLWERGQVYEAYSSFFIGADVKPGTYSLKIALVNPDGIPSIQLGQEGDDGFRKYSLGTVTIEAGKGKEKSDTLYFNLARSKDATAIVGVQNTDRPFWYVAPINDGQYLLSVSDAPGEIHNTEQSFGVRWTELKEFNTLVYHSGEAQAGEGGWFERDIWIEYHQHGNWIRIPLAVWNPVYPFSADAGNRVYTATFNTVMADGIRLCGYVGRRHSKWISIRELEVFKK